MVELVVRILAEQQDDGYLYEVEEDGEEDGHVPVEQHQRLGVDHHLVALRLLAVPVDEMLEVRKLRLLLVIDRERDYLVGVFGVEVVLEGLGEEWQLDVEFFFGLGGSQHPEGEFRGITVHALDSSGLRSANNYII